MTRRSVSRASRTGTAELLDVVSLVSQAIWADLRRSGPPIEPTQWATLRLIAAEPWTVSEVARHKGVSLPTMSRSIDMLVRRGWVARSADAADRRHTLVRLTPDGHRLLGDCRRRIEEALAARLEVLTDEQRAQVTASLRVLRDALGLRGCRRRAGPTRARPR